METAGHCDPRTKHFHSNPVSLQRGSCKHWRMSVSAINESNFHLAAVADGKAWPSIGIEPRTIFWEPFRTCVVTLLKRFKLRHMAFLIVDYFEVRRIISGRYVLHRSHILTIGDFQHYRYEPHRHSVNNILCIKITIHTLWHPYLPQNGDIKLTN